ncbi:MAG: beta-galactosidase [Oscillospiraceae bacterium]|jgi:beta-galactosidase/beta-glucuronidase|nr:beta-galactosidase [Oscillospiraceae bacterium]
MRNEHPKPQFCRDSWRNLNGEWQFTIDFGGGAPGGYQDPETVLDRKIQVPFCPESALSGIGYTGFMPTVWYKRKIGIAAQELEGRVLLHFGAADYETTVYINGREAGKHKGGYASFAFDVTALLTPGDNDLTVRADDDLRGGRQPRGKQCPQVKSCGCEYTRTTGIWQTVWLEFVPDVYISRVKTETDYITGQVSFYAEIKGGDPSGQVLAAQLSFDGEPAASVSAPAAVTGMLTASVPNAKLWDVGRPNLYDVIFTLTNPDGKVSDRVRSYFGIRGVETKNGRLYINGKPVFQRLVLDQGFYPDGIYTAPDDAALERDIELSMALGFNGARLHQKVFEERFLYHADRMGYIVWGEHGNWGLNCGDGMAIYHFLAEWLEIVERDYNHPSIVCWCPFNEVSENNNPLKNPDLLTTVYTVTKALERQRPVIDTSGFFHAGATDIYDTHDYEQDVQIFRDNYAHIKTGETVHDPHRHGQAYDGKPFFVSEYGGAKWSAEAGESWGYGEAPRDMREFLERYAALTGTLLQNENVCGFCYTQLYDVEQEQNGLYTYQREPKFPGEIYDAIRAANAQKAGCEE